MKLVILEKELFSLSKKLKDLSIDIISENTYYGNMVHSMVFSEKKKRILIADDNKLNIKLLTYMLETSHVDITSVLDGEEALNILKKSQFNNNNRFDVVFLDNNMPILSGNEVLSSLRKIEQEENLKPIFAISITGDPTLNESEKNLYNLMVQKPFNKENVRDALKKVK
jgi:CheY-like chemotaxis protein